MVKNGGEKEMSKSGWKLGNNLAKLDTRQCSDFALEN